MDYCPGDSQLYSMRVDENSALHSKKMDVIKDTGTEHKMISRSVCDCMGVFLCIDCIE